MLYFFYHAPSNIGAFGQIVDILEGNSDRLAGVAFLATGRGQVFFVNHGTVREWYFHPLAVEALLDMF